MFKFTEVKFRLGEKNKSICFVIPTGANVMSEVEGSLGFARDDSENFARDDSENFARDDSVLNLSSRPERM